MGGPAAFPTSWHQGLRIAELASPRDAKRGDGVGGLVDDQMLS